VKKDTKEPVIIKLSKVFSLGYSEDSTPSDKTHLLQEANILAQLRYLEGIPTYFGLHRIRHDNNLEQLALIAQRIEGDNIEKIFQHRQNKRFTAIEALDFLKKAALILKETHKRNIIHCDLKFSNFMIDRRDRLSIIDWGSAQIIDRAKAEKNVKQKKPIVGTIQFMSYEHLIGRALDERTDIYALGLVVAVLTYGPAISQRYIFDKDKHTVERPKSELIKVLSNGETPKFHLIAKPRNQAEQKILEIVYQMTAPNKYLRPRSMQAVLDKL